MKVGDMCMENCLRDFSAPLRDDFEIRHVCAGSLGFFGSGSGSGGGEAEWLGRAPVRGCDSEMRRKVGAFTGSLEMEVNMGGCWLRRGVEAI